MIDFAEINDSLERTQTLPVLTVETQLQEALQRERAARIEASELFCQNVELVREVARLRYAAHGERAPKPQRLAPVAQRPEDTEQMLFEVCGALKLTLSRVLAECQMREVSLNCGQAASSTLLEACDKLENILSDPESRSPAASSLVARVDDAHTARVVSLAHVRPEARP